MNTQEQIALLRALREVLCHEIEDRYRVAQREVTYLNDQARVSLPAPSASGEARHATGKPVPEELGPRHSSSS